MIRNYGDRIYTLCTAFELIRKYGGTVCILFTALELIGSVSVKYVRYAQLLN